MEKNSAKGKSRAQSPMPALPTSAPLTKQRGPFRRSFAIERTEAVSVQYQRILNARALNCKAKAYTQSASPATITRVLLWPQRRELPITNQKFRDGVPHETKAHAIAKPAKTTRKLTPKQRLEKTVPNLRSQEVSREMVPGAADFRKRCWRMSID